MPCDDCKFAKWNRTTSGRLHPNKMGRCEWVFLPPLVPKAYRFAYGKPGEYPNPSGGYIERGATYTDNCACFTPRG